MKAITLTQPWATAIVLGNKRVETRSWRTQYRGPLAIHASARMPREARDFAMSELALGRLVTPLPCGAVLCIARLVDCRPTEEVALEVGALERHYGDFEPGRWAWLLDDVEVLAEPVPARGTLGLWEWKRDAD